MFNDEILKSIMTIKYKDLIKNPKNVITRQFLEEYLEIVYSSKDLKMIKLKLNEIIIECPSVISNNDGEAIIANILVKSAQKLDDEINRKNTLNQAVDMMTANPESIRLDKIAKLLAEMGELCLIIKIACRKAIYYRILLEKDNINYDNISHLTSGLSQYSNEKNKFYHEFKECLFYIFKLLTELHFSIQNNEKEYQSNAPEFMRNFFKNTKLTTEEKKLLQNQCITEIIQIDDQFLHNMLFDHMNALDLLANISQFKSKYIEDYLNKLIAIDKTDPKKHESLFKYYYKNEDYANAFNKLLSIIKILKKH